MSRLIWSAIALLIGLTGFFMTQENEPTIGTNAHIVSFAYSHSGSSTNEIYSYEVETDDTSGEITVNYDFSCGYKTYSLTADEELMKELAEIIDAHDLIKWDGFDKSDSRVADGSGFDIGVRFDDGTEINASGSNSFPKGYGDASRAIDELFRGYLKKCGVEMEGGY